MKTDNKKVGPYYVHASSQSDFVKRTTQILQTDQCDDMGEDYDTLEQVDIREQQ